MLRSSAFHYNYGEVWSFFHINIYSEYHEYYIYQKNNEADFSNRKQLGPSRGAIPFCFDTKRKDV